MLKRILFFSGVLVLGIIIGNTFFGSSLADNIEANSKNEIKITFPKNKQGQTYGSASDAPSSEDEPDLIRAYGIDGTIGYVKKEDLDGPQPKTPEEAIRLTNEAKPREIPLYEVDGETIIGKFIVGE